MDCSELILSNNTYDFIVTRDEVETPLLEPVCIQPIDQRYSIWYYDRATLPPLSISRYSYTSIPKCFWLMDSTSLEVSGILALQNQPTLSLTGQGVFIGVIDTGIDYTHKVFRNENGESRIFSIWDQTAVPDSGASVSERQSGSRSGANHMPEGFLYGTEYTKEQINIALQAKNPYEIVPENDTNGHGTFLASIAAGSEDMENDFIGAAPRSELVIVKLKEAKQNVREFFYLPENEPLYQENDIMAGIAYLEAVANRENRPLVILLGVGSNQGSHTGNSPLEIYMDVIGIQQERAIVTPTGNQATARHHFYGEATSTLTPVAVELNVESGVEGFCMELWSFAPELVRVVVKSPTGQQSQGGFPLIPQTQSTNFIFENTTLTLDYRIAGRGNGDLVIFFRFSQPTEGIWTVLVYPETSITGAFHMWLPIQSLVGSDVTFIQPNPDTTLTTPATAQVPITVAGYDGLTGARYINSGRGYDGRGRIKPDFAAPCVEVSGAGRRNDYTLSTGTSIAAAITAGAAAQCMEWGIIRGNVPTMNSVEIKNLLIRGCQRENNQVYPNQEWGFGKLNAYNSFVVLRK